MNLFIKLFILCLSDFKKKIHGGKCDSDNCPFGVFSTLSLLLRNAVLTDVDEFDRIGYFSPF